MVAALILAVGLLACIAVVLNYLDGGQPDTTDILREMDEWRSGWEEEWRQENDGRITSMLIADVAASMTKSRDALTAAQAAAAKAKMAAAKEAAAVEREREAASSPAINDVTSALVGMGWAASESKPLAQGAVRALGPNASLEELTRYALTHR